MKELLPASFGDEKLLGLNRRWRFYRYLSGNLPLKPWRGDFRAFQGVFGGVENGHERLPKSVFETFMLAPARYRKHLDGAWPASGIAKENGKDT